MDLLISGYNRGKKKVPSDVSPIFNNKRFLQDLSHENIGKYITAIDVLMHNAVSDPHISLMLLHKNQWSFSWSELVYSFQLTTNQWADSD